MIPDEPEHDDPLKDFGETFLVLLKFVAAVLALLLFLRVGLQG